jgi:hypothetical protein
VVALLDPGSAAEPLRVVMRAPLSWGEPGSTISQRLGVGELGDMLLGFATREGTPRNTAGETVPPAEPRGLPRG